MTAAKNFWEATKTGDVEKIKPYVTKSSYDLAEEQTETKKMEGDYILGESTLEGDKAIIPTTLNNKGFEIKLKTIVVKEEGQWKVDAHQTSLSMLENMGELMKGLGEAMGKAFGEGVKGFKEGMTEGLKELEKTFPPEKKEEENRKEN